MLSCRQNNEYLKKADYLYAEWRDREGLLELGHTYPDKEFILFLPQEMPNDEELIKYNNYCRKKLYFRVFNEQQVEICNRLNLKFYFGFPFTSFSQLQGAIDKGASMAYITSPLMNDLSAVKRLEIPVFTFANLANETYVAPNSTAINNWIRPEDMRLYNNYIDAVCFAWKDLRQERALYRVYAENGEWSGNINDIIVNLNINAVNRMIPPDFAENRIKCKQMCLTKGRNCNICKNSLDLANKDLLEPYKNKINKRGTT